MKGIVFDMLRDMVEERFGVEGWQAVLDHAGSDGLYVSTETYADSELLDLVGAASEVSQIAADELVFAFGQFMVREFYLRFPHYYDNCDGLINFLLSVDQVIHVEVRKLYPDAAVPQFSYQQDNPQQLTMIYQSERQLCRLAEGLIDGGARHYGERYTLEHDLCMHRGDDASPGYYLALTTG